MDKNCITYFDADEPIESDEQKRVRRVCICASVDKQYDIVDPYRLLLFCTIPRSRKEIENFLCCKHAANVRRKYVKTLIDLGLLQMTLPHKPTSKYQKYFTVAK